MYAEPGPKSTRLLNIVNCAKMVTDLEYIRTVWSVQYG